MFLLKLLASTLCFLLCTASLPATVLTTAQFNGSTYLVLDSKTWDKQEAEAKILGGDLVTINSAQENAWIAQTLLASIKIPYSTAWIGLYDPTATGAFTWASGQPVVYTNWQTGDPNNLGSERYTQIYETGLWNNLQNQSLEAIVKLSATPAPEPTTFILIGAGLLAVGIMGQRRRKI